MKSPIELLMEMLADCKRLHCGEKGLDRDLTTIKSRFKHEGYSFLTVTLPILADAVDLGLSIGRFTCPKNFKRVPRKALPRVFSGLLCEVFDIDSGNLKDNASVEAVLSLRQVLRFFKKVTLSNHRVDELDRKAKDDFRQNEVPLQNQEFDPRREHHLSLACRYILPGLDLLHSDRIFDRHGPGAVYEGVTSNRKWSLVVRSLLSGASEFCPPELADFGALERASHSIRNLGFEETRESGFESDDESTSNCVRTGSNPGFGPARSVSLSSDSPQAEAVNLQSISRSAAPVETGLVSAYSRVETRGDAPSSKEEDDLIGWSSSSKSRLVSVPKNSTSRRTITIEPCLNQFIQQGLNGYLRDSIESCKVLSRCLDLTDQSINQKLALEGSRTGEWSTLDLSSASDLLSVKLVELVFRGHPNFLSRMLECRSPYCEDSDVFPILKFAGMGNALTFPVQSICFAMLAIAAILETEGRKPSKWNVRRAASNVRVYGDDIIVRSEHSHRVIDWITAFGLKVNVRKSFTEGYFRESCGVDAYRGTDVTPVYLRQCPVENTSEASAIGKLVSASNQLWLRGYYLTAEILREEVEKRLKKRLPLVSKESGALGWFSRKDCSYATSWNKNTQELQLKAPVIVTLSQRDNLNGYPALLKFFLTPLISRVKGHLKRSHRRFRTKIVWKNIPVRVCT